MNKTQVRKYFLALVSSIVLEVSAVIILVLDYQWFSGSTNNWDIPSTAQIMVIVFAILLVLGGATLFGMRNEI